MPPLASITDLRALLAARFPEKIRKSEGMVVTGAAGIDDTLGGGLPLSRTTELVCAAPSCGGQSVLASLLEATRASRQRLVLVEAVDAFAPCEIETDFLRHLVWVRAQGPEQALAAADIVVRDGNYTTLLLDLRDVPERALRRLPASSWYRLQRAVEGSSLALLVLSPFPLVPSATWRLGLRTSLPLAGCHKVSAQLTDGLSPELARGQSPATLTA